LVMMHGISSNIQMWRENGYTEQLAGDYRLILLDARGHGASDKPHSPGEYRADLIAGDVVAVLDDLGVKKTHYLGYSMGAAIGFFCLTRYALARFDSLILGGYGPYRSRMGQERQGPSPLRRAFEVGVEKGVDAYIAERERIIGRPMPANWRARQRVNDFRALIAMIDAMVQWPSAEELLPRMTLPCLVYAGDRDNLYSGAKEGASRMPNATFVSLPGLDHQQAQERIDLVLPHIKKFLAEVSKS